ncbi:MAG: hypothetical protein R6W91_06600 [Thermoplasmata archaeon]
MLLGGATIGSSVHDISAGVRNAPEEVRSTQTWNLIDHTCTDIHQIPESAILEAKSDLHIGYGHTSHGSQLITGMDGLVGFMNGLDYTEDLYEYNNGGTGGALDLRDGCFSGASDLGNPDRIAWASATQDYLDEHSDLNVVIWSWCGQVSSASEEDIETYLDLMTELENDNPDVHFVYMTGHLDGTGLDGNLHLRNEQIRAYCLANDKILYDFADIESYDPDGNYFGDKMPNDNCDYDSDGDGSTDSNWALEWQDSHTEGTDWYSCSSAHSQALNANQKAYAAWWLWAMLAGWDQGGNPDAVDTDGDGVYDNLDDFPNDVNESVDTDGDGIGNNADTDDDGDGVDDADDAYPYDPTRSDEETPGFGLMTIVAAILIACVVLPRKR